MHLIYRLLKYIIYTILLFFFLVRIVLLTYSTYQLRTKYYIIHRYSSPFFIVQISHKLWRYPLIRSQPFFDSALSSQPILPLPTIIITTSSDNDNNNNNNDGRINRWCFNRFEYRVWREGERVSPTTVDLGKPERVTMSPVCATGGTRSVRVTQNTYNNNTNYIVKRISIITTINILWNLYITIIIITNKQTTNNNNNNNNNNNYIVKSIY